MHSNVMKTITISTHKKDEILDITDLIEEELGKSEEKDGVCTVFILHTTCALTTADLDPGTDQDFLDFLRASVPHIGWRHPHDPTHTPDHLLSSLIGSSIPIPFENKRLILGTWQRVILVELSGPRERKIVISA